MIEWIKILIELICFVVLIAITLTVYSYHDYKKITSKYATIDFKDFIKLYDVAPDKWEFDHQRSGSFLHMLYYDVGNKIDGEDVFMSTFHGYYELKKFYKNYKKAKKQKSKELLMKTLGQCWEKDIRS